MMKLALSTLALRTTGKTKALTVKTAIRAGAMDARGDEGRAGLNALRDLRR